MRLRRELSWRREWVGRGVLAFYVYAVQRIGMSGPVKRPVAVYRNFGFDFGSALVSNVMVSRMQA